MDLSIYNIIQKPRVSIKAYTLNQKMGKLILEVHPDANKSLIKEALKKLFNVEVASVKTVVVKGKQRRAGRHQYTTKSKKKAIITLKEGHSFDASAQPESVEEHTASAA